MQDSNLKQISEKLDQIDAKLDQFMLKNENRVTKLVIRPHTNGSVNRATNAVKFIITQVARS